MSLRLLPLPLLLIAVVGIPMALQIVPPNSVYGVRISHTLGSPDVWYTANFWAGLTGVVLGVLGAGAVALLSKRAKISDKTRVVVAASAAVFAAVAMTLAGLLSA